MEINRTLLAFCRTVHIYLTMLGLLVMLLFGITGFTINHEEWFGGRNAASMTEHTGTVPPELIAQRDYLRIVEHLRQTLKIRGAMENFADDFADLAITFKQPGEVWDITVEKSTGQVSARSEQYGFVAIINNLHRGRYTGTAWSWVIDISALLIVLACLTGFVLWLALPRRKKLGILYLAVGTLATMVVIYFFVPGGDAPVPGQGQTQRGDER